MIAWDPIWAK